MVGLADGPAYMNYKYLKTYCYNILDRITFVDERLSFAVLRTTILLVSIKTRATG